MIYISTHAGINHSVNEDAVLVGSDILTENSEELPEPENGFVCIADGVGGNRCGDKASQFVLAALASWNEDNEKEGNLKSYLKKTNERLIAAAVNDGFAPEMATTLTGIYFSSHGNKLIHIGNTRAFIKQGKYLKQITSDHTTYNWLIRSGQTEAAENCNKNEITNCFGGNNPELLSKLYIADCGQFSLAVLTSDGIHEYIDLDKLENIINSEGSYSDKCNEIINRAIEAGSQDDLSVVIICLSSE